MERRELTAEELKTGLDHASAYIRDNNRRNLPLPLKVIVAGGAVSVLHLKNRTTTRDFDFWSSDFYANRLLNEAGRAVAEELGYPLDWLNSNMTVIVTENQNYERTLQETSIQQGILLHPTPEIHAYIADWRYQLTRKLWASYSPSRTQKDMDDAVAILDVLVIGNGDKPLRKSAIRGWYVDNDFFKDDKLEALNAMYVAATGRQGIE